MVKLDYVSIPGYQLCLHTARIQLLIIDIAGYEERTQEFYMVLNFEINAFKVIF